MAKEIGAVSTEKIQSATTSEIACQSTPPRSTGGVDLIYYLLFRTSLIGCDQAIVVRVMGLNFSKSVFQLCTGLLLEASQTAHFLVC